MSSREPWSPGGQADWDRLHAQALDVLRRAKTFSLTAMVLVDDEEGRPHSVPATVSGSCQTAAHVRALMWAMGASLTGMEEQFEAAEGGDHDAAA